MQKTLAPILFFAILILCLSGLISSALALVLGFSFTLLMGKQYESLTQIGIKHLLKLSIIGLGFGMYIDETLKIGKEGFSITLLTIVITLALGWLLTKVLKLDLQLGYLISSGTSICGGSAIAAVSSVIKAPPKLISIALGVVFFLNSIALFIFPGLGHFFGLNQHEFGLWAAIAIHDTSSVVGAALDYGEEALQVATTVKLSRTLWIIPVSLVSMFLFKTKDGKLKLPWFILFFVLAVLANSYLPLPELLTSGITEASKRMLVATLFLVGTTLSVKDLKKTGVKPFILGICLWITISVIALAAIKFT